MSARWSSRAAVSPSSGPTTSREPLGVNSISRRQHGELVAAEAYDEDIVGQAAAEPIRQDLKQPVADRMPKGVVDLLEAVEVQGQQQARVVGLERFLKPFHKYRSIRETSEEVMLGLVSHPAFGLGELFDVGRHAANHTVVDRSGSQSLLESHRPRQAE